MIVFQFVPSKCYPKIINLISDQFPSSRFVHEVFEFKETNSSTANPLELTPNNHKFKRCDFMYGIFSKNKIKKQNGDFWLTIKLPEKRIFEEFFCAIKHYGSAEFGFLSKNDTYDSKLHELCSPLFHMTYNEFKLSVENKKINSIINDETYNIREDLIPDGDFDYIGNFDNWQKTIEDIKILTGLDLSSLANERLYSYQESA